MLRSPIYTAIGQVLSLRGIRASGIIGIIMAGLVFPGRSTAATQDFGQAQVNGTGSAPRLLTYTGLANTPTFSFVYGRDFKLGTPSCTSGTCSVSVVFQPVYPGLRQDAVAVKDQQGNLLAITLLHGIGVAPEAAIYPGTITTYAGTGRIGYSPDGQSAASAKFANPQGVAIDAIGNIYIADSLNQVVRQVSVSTGTVRTIAGVAFGTGPIVDGGQATQTPLNNPAAVAVDGAGNVYIADQGNNAIRKVTAATGVITTVAGGGHTRSGADGFGDGGPATNAILYGPADIALDASANLYIADAFHGLIRKVDVSTGIITVVAGGGNSSGSDGFGDGLLATQAGLNNPTGIAVDAAGNLYIADTGHSLIRFVAAGSGIISAIAGNGIPGYNGDLGPAINAELAGPSCVRVDAAGNVYIADTGNNAIRQVQAASGTINTIAGNGAYSYYGDGGISTGANLASPSGLALDASGNVYIADNGNNVIRKVAFQSPTISFGTTTIGLASAPQFLNVLNIGNQPLNFSALNLTGIPNFKQQASGYVDCSASSSVAAGSACVIAVAFVPSTTFSLTGSITATTNALNLSASSAVAALQGIGASGPAPRVALSAANLSFGNQATGSSAVLAVMLTNSGNAPLGISNIWVAGANSAEFAVSTTCGAVVAANVSCTVNVTFTPTAAGPRFATLIFNDSVANSPQTVALTGTGVLTARASLSSANLNFGSQSVGTASGSQTINLISSGSIALPISSIQLLGANAAEFKLSTSCSQSLATGSSCNASVTFSPLAAGSKTALLVFTTGAPDSPETVSITGVGIDPAGTVPHTGTGGPTGRPARANFTVWRPVNGTWFVQPGDGRPAIVQQGGLPGDIPVPGDYDGDGNTDFAVWRPSNGMWFIIPSNGGPTIVQQWGLPGDIPVPGDYDGDGKTDFAVWRPAIGTWFLLPSSRPGTLVIQQWGLPGDIPVPNDYDGDGKTDFAVWRPVNGIWFVLPTGNPGLPLVQQWGLPGDIPIPGDYDGDGKTDFAVWRPAIGTWFVIPTSHPANLLIQQWGLKGDKPIAKDFNNDGKTDFAVWRPSEGGWYVLTTDMLSSYPKPAIYKQWGLPGDIPL
ncbi:MAG TPA: choice-of-anchor D domain-containing protein [Bryobacteraceae bacterium]|nr:choice-of-anchor D domain-containing protein [Bryobacteraceae bacterium]